MKLEDFIEQFDNKNSIVLLEGKRNVLPEDQEKLYALGKLLAEKTSNMIFRSGNASGSDQFFSDGVASVDKLRLQVITPYSGHRSRYNRANETFNLDTIDIANEPNVIYHTKSNKKIKNLVDRYVEGKRDRFTQKAAYLIRDTIKVVGTSEIKPATFGIFYDDIENPETGGTGHTMKVCRENNIPLINQSVWFNWVNQ